MDNLNPVQIAVGILILANRDKVKVIEKRKKKRKITSKFAMSRDKAT